MIQRIQSVYLFLVASLMVACMFFPVVHLRVGDSDYYELMNYGMVSIASGSVVSYSAWGLMAILVLSAIVALVTIFMFKNRVLQMRMTVFNVLLQLGYYITLGVFVYRHFTDDMFSMTRVALPSCLPLIGIILNYLAWRAIGKDEFLVRAADRLR